MIEISETRIDTEKLLASVQDPRCGAAVLFVGMTRQFTGSRETATLSYECYESMAMEQLQTLREQCQKKWPIFHCSICHRTGEVKIGEASVAVAVSSPHRADAFAAGQWLIDSLKEIVPIWKQERWTDGNSEWIHPTSSKSPK